MTFPSEAKASTSEAVDPSRPWLAFPVEFPTVRSEVKHPDYAFFHDDKFLSEMHAENKARLLTSFAEHKDTASVILLQGGSSKDFEMYDSDTSKCEFRQESYFRYLFGVNEPDCYALLDLATQEAVLFIPEVLPEWARWNGEEILPAVYNKRYGFAQTYNTKQLHAILQERKVNKVFVLSGLNTDSGSDTTTTATFAELGEYTVDKTTLHPILSEQRVIKTEKEITLMRKANLVSSQAHVYVMRHVKPGMTEMQCEALFKAWCMYYAGSRHVAYTCICGSGPHGSILHYGHSVRPNNRLMLQGDRVLLDMGAEYNGYATDITRSYPVNGKFTTDQALIHNAVMEASQAVLAAMKPGVSWPDMHRLAEKVMLEHLLKIGIVQGALEDLIANHLGAVFMPHGLGHLLGLNVHDVGGYGVNDPPKSTEPGVCYLRTSRVLKAGMVITVEPGIYFNDPTLNKALADAKQAPFINAEVLERFRGTGGVRIEDDVLVTETGCENLTVAPNTIEEIEQVMNR